MLLSTPSAYLPPQRPPGANDSWAGDDEFFQPVRPLRQRPQQSSYANATKTHATNTSTANRNEQTLRDTEIQRLNRTQILRRTEPNTTVTDIVHQLTYQLGVEESQLLEGVLRDPKDNRRFYITYKTTDMKHYAMGKGFTIGNLHIKPRPDTTDGYIPFPPYYVDITTLDQLLRPYGELISSSFVTTKQNTRIAGYRFSLKLKPGILRPVSITYSQFLMEIKYSDDRKQCTYCKIYGHVTAICRKRQAAQAEIQANRDEEKAARTTAWRTQLDAIQTTTEDYIKTAHFWHLHKLQTAADVYQADLDQLRQAQADDAAVTRWTDAYHQLCDHLIADHDDHLSDLASENLEQKKDATADYRKAGGRPPEAFDDDMEIDVVSTTQLAASFTPLDAPDAPDGDELDDFRTQLNRYAAQLEREALSRALLAAETIANAVSVPLVATVDVVPSVAPVTVHTPPSSLAQSRTSTTTSISVQSPLSSPQVTPRKVDKKNNPFMQPVIQLDRPPPHADDVDGRKAYFATMADKLPKDFGPTHCYSVLQFTTSTLNFQNLFFNALLDACIAQKLHTVNPAAMVLQHAKTDVSHRFLFVHTEAVKDLALYVLQSAHKKQVLVLTSEVNVTPNSKFDPATAGDTTVIK